MLTTMLFRCLRTIRPICLLGILLAVLTWLVPEAVAQEDGGTTASSGQYIRKEVDQKLAKRIRTSKINVMLREGLTSANEKMFEEYYEKCVFPTWTDPENFSVKEKSNTPRQRIISDLKRAKSGSATYGRFNNIVLKQMIEFVKGNYHPATRFNAMLLIGELNEKKPVVEYGSGDPEPLNAALPMLLSASKNVNLPDAVRVAAMLGLIRHAKYGAKDDDSRKKISDLMLSVAVTRVAPQGRSKDGHAWFRRLAINTLGQFGVPGNGGIVAKSLADIMSEANAPLSVRCEAADALGWIDLTSSGLDPVTVIRSLQKLFLEVAKEEIRLAKEDEDYQVNARKLKTRLTAILAALNGSKNRNNNSGKGIAPLATKPEDEKLLRSLTSEIERLLSRDYLDNSDLVPKTEKPKKKKIDKKKDPFGMRPGYGDDPNPLGPGGALGPGGPGPLGIRAAEADPAKPVLDKIMAELIRLVKEHEEGQEGS